MNKSFDELFRGYKEGLLTQEELDLFLKLLQQEEHAANFNESIGQLLIKSTVSEKVDESKAKFLFENIMRAAAKKEALPAKRITVKGRSKVITFLQIAAAACFIGLIVTGGLFWFNKGNKKELAKTEEKKNDYKNDVFPGSNKAILTLADGSAIVLSDAKNGSVANQGGTKVIKTDGKLAYNILNGQTKEVVYNTISTPRGGQYQVTLPDGTMVWLNAASSLHFPTAFSGKLRRVEITGEAYFEVKKDAFMPFVVSVDGAEVQVLGTHFNVMAYKEEGAVRTTLIEGSVKFTSGSNSNLLKPGQQSQLLKNGSIRVVSGVDMEEVMAWKNGLFHFESSDIETVLRQLSRWYDVDVVFKGEKNTDPLYFEVPQDTKLADVLKALQISAGAKFQIQGKQIIVSR